MDVIFFGPPGAGKGTQAKILQQRFGIRQVSTGDLLREHRRREDDIGRRAQAYLDRGLLVPDDVILDIIRVELDKGGTLLFDGFPRTRAQAEALATLLQQHGKGLPLLVVFELDRAEVFRRLMGRWTNPKTGRVYHDIYDPPPPDKIDVDGTPLVRRPDDLPETIETRYDVYRKEADELLRYYREILGGNIVDVDARLPVESAAELIARKLQAPPRPITQ